MLDTMDVNIGRLLHHLEDRGIADNTIVIFLVENGPDPSQLPLSDSPTYDKVYFEDFDGDVSDLGQNGIYAD